MKKIFVVLAAIFGLFAIAGCGQQMPVTVYNTVPVVAQQWISIEANTGSFGQQFVPTSDAMSSDSCNTTNSFTFNSKENDTLSVSAYGAAYTDATDMTLTAFSISPTVQVLYGSFLSSPHWYAEVNSTSVIFYKK